MPSLETFTPGHPMTPIPLHNLGALRPASMCIETAEGVRIDSGGTSYLCDAPLSQCLGALGLPSLDAPREIDHSWVAVDGGWRNEGTGEVLGALEPQGAQ